MGGINCMQWAVPTVRKRGGINCMLSKGSKTQPEERRGLNISETQAEFSSLTVKLVKLQP
uniref:Uncharacterized protein n=1 Tax=Anguilla anguilla TaxID=7936 RepID=A0A0E9SS91_ANGAN